jgi:hypothetical protein
VVVEGANQLRPGTVVKAREVEIAGAVLDFDTERSSNKHVADR